MAAAAAISGRRAPHRARLLPWQSRPILSRYTTGMSVGSSANTPVRAVIYTRVSDDPAATFRSVEEQEAECRQVAAREGWTVIRVFTDNDRSASRYARRERPGYRAVSDFLRAGAADVLVTWEGSRAQRDLEAYVSLRKLCAEQRVLWSYSGKVYDLDDTDDRFSTGLDALLAERESGVTRKRVLRAMRANASNGRPHGPVLFGYRRVYDEHTGKLIEQVIREDQAAIVREAAARVARGEAPHAVAVDLNRRGIPSPGGAAWDITSVRRLVVNPAYVGHRVHLPEEERRRKPGSARPIVGTASWPAIVDDKTWSRCVARFATSAPVGSHGAIKWLLSGIGRCAVCGARLRVQKAQRRDYSTYVCSARSCVSIRAKGLDTFVALVIVERLSQPDALAELTPKTDPAATAVAEARELRERLDGFIAMAAAGKLTPASLAKIEADLLPKIEDADRRGRQAVASPVLRELAGPDAARRWDRLPVAVRREVVTLLAEVRVRPAGKGARYVDRELADIDPDLARIDPARVDITPRRRQV